MIARHSWQLPTRVVLVFIGVCLLLPSGLFQSNDLQPSEQGNNLPSKDAYSGQTPLNAGSELVDGHPISDHGVQQTQEAHETAQHSGTHDESGLQSEALRWPDAAEGGATHQAEFLPAPEASATAADTGSAAAALLNVSTSSAATLAVDGALSGALLAGEPHAELSLPDTPLPPAVVPPLLGAGEDAPGEEDEERHNFALAKDGAKIVAANKEARKPESVLDSDGDTFLRNDCRADKWLILELSQVAKVDTLKLSQFELYSSRVAEFEVYGRRSHPRSDGPDYARGLNASAWQLLGRFTAANAKGTQAFRIQQPEWAKYLQLRLVSHHGSEPVCALNDVRVHGKSAVEDLEDRLAAPDAEEEQEEEPVSEPAQEPDQEGAPAAQPELPRDEAVAGGGAAGGLEIGNGSGGGGGVDSGVGVASQDAAGQPAAPVEAGSSGALGVHGLNAPLEGGQEGQAVGTGAAGEGAPAQEVVEGRTPVHEEEQQQGQQQGQPGAEPRGGVLPPVLEALGSGLKRLIAPPGAGRRRAPYSGAPTNASRIAPPVADDDSAALSVPCEAPGDGGVPGRQASMPASGGGAPAAGVPSEEAAACRGPECEPAARPAGNASGAAAAAEGTAAVTAAQEAAAQGALVGAWGVTEGTQAAITNRHAAAERERVSAELALAANSAGSAAARHGGSVYDMLVAEIKALKLQQKAAPRALADLQRNVSAAVASLAAELADFHARLGELEAAAGARDAVCLARLAPEHAVALPAPTGNGSRLSAPPQPLLHEDSQLQQQQQQQQQQQLERRVQVREGEEVGEGGEVDVGALAADLAELRAAVGRSSRREHAMVMVVAALCAMMFLSFPCLGGRRSPLFRGAVLCLALGNGVGGLLLHWANALGPDKLPLATHLQRFVGM